MSRSRWKEAVDPLVLTPVLALMVISLFNLYSASQGGLNGSPHKSQIMWFTIGLIAMAAAALIDMRTLERMTPTIFVLALIPLAAVHFLGHKAGGARSWLQLGPFTLQPSEPMKIALILMLARYFGRAPEEPPYSLFDLWKPTLILLIPLGLIMKEPDMGTGLIYVATVGSLYLFLGLSRRTFWGSIGLVAVSVAAVWLWKGDPLFFLKAHQKARLATFLNPESDPLGVGYHVIQSKIAIGSGGLWGRGYLKGLQTQFSFLPEQHTDFAFSVLAEELGFVASVGVVVAFAVLVGRAFNVASHARDSFSAILATGFGILIFWHFLVNIAMVAGLLPVIGVPLPFLSYGGSSAVTMLTGVGFLLNVARGRHFF
ncbi:MAG: rod shape-determining protein RodA [Chrysiogenetes bacterium]|nr:rod shape-determining protein RodA [Chrysiogenetes bacterium]